MSTSRRFFTCWFSNPPQFSQAPCDVAGESLACVEQVIKEVFYCFGILTVSFNNRKLVVSHIPVCARFVLSDDFSDSTDSYAEA